jgi:hypothetical protein
MENVFLLVAGVNYTSLMRPLRLVIRFAHETASLSSAGAFICLWQANPGPHSAEAEMCSTC